ncbi:MAG: CPBP family intramembrane metalloprotease [Victivallales bacterium]|nr:CPBP family intramembrane metalloprotease [Victivallales bacterium]
MQVIDNKVVTDNSLERCDRLAMVAGLLGFVLSAGDFTRFISTGPSWFLLGIFYAVFCSFFILGGYAFGHRITGVPWADLIPLVHCGLWKRLLTIVIAAGLLAVLVTAVNFGMAHGVSDVDSFFPLQYIKEADWLRRLRILVQVVVCAPVSEEFFFRLALPRWLKTRMASKNLADWIASLAFSLIHLIWWGIPGLFLFGIVLCYLRRKQDIFTCLGVHALYNLLVAVVAISLGS